jgi:hypothetical protein
MRQPVISEEAQRARDICLERAHTLLDAAEHEEKPERKAALELLALSYKHATERP